jgi:hypothetical protein
MVADHQSGKGQRRMMAGDSLSHTNPYRSRPSGEPSACGSDQTIALDFAQDFAERWHRHLRQRLAGIYFIGSLAHGGYSERYSDIDVLLIAEELKSDELDVVNKQGAAHSSALAARLSLFWADSRFKVGRFPPLDRIDYLDHAVPIVEQRRVVTSRPTVSEVRAYLRAEPLRSWAQSVLRFNALEELAVEDYKRYLRTVLYPARFLYSWDTGKVASNDDAVAYLKERNLVGLEFDLIARALQCRFQGNDPLPLFSQRKRLLPLLDICVKRTAQKC